MGMSTEPGHTALTRTAWGASSIAIDLTRAFSAPLLAGSRPRHAAQSYLTQSEVAFSNAF
jgi:hypothetical protein